MTPATELQAPPSAVATMIFYAVWPRTKLHNRFAAMIFLPPATQEVPLRSGAGERKAEGAQEMLAQLGAS